jgi:hypothetical protein
MDQDEDGVGGENPGDRFETTFTISAGPEVVARFDFGTTSSPVAEGYTRHPANHRYSVEDGYGWFVGSVFGLSRVGADALLRDFNYTEDATFALDLANGQYDITVTLGDLAEAHDLMGVFLEGEQVDMVTTAAGQNAVGTYRITVRDGQLNLRLFDLGGSDEWVMINGLDVVTAGTAIESAALHIASFSSATPQIDGTNRSDQERAARRSRSSVLSIANETASHLLLSERSGRRHTTLGSFDNEARDKAFSMLVDCLNEKEFKQNPFASFLPQWGELF